MKYVAIRRAELSIYKVVLVSLINGCHIKSMNGPQGIYIDTKPLKFKQIAAYGNFLIEEDTPFINITRIKVPR